jgi:hypothetical protein
MVGPETASTFRAWDPANCDESDVEDTKADTVEAAARAYVENTPDYITDNATSVDVRVRAADGKCYVVCVTLDYVVDYYTSQAKLYPEPTSEDDR